MNKSSFRKPKPKDAHNFHTANIGYGSVPAIHILSVKSLPNFQEKKKQDKLKQSMEQEDLKAKVKAESKRNSQRRWALKKEAINCGIHLQGDYAQINVSFPIPDYVVANLHEFQHTAPNKVHNIPCQWNPLENILQPDISIPMGTMAKAPIRLERSTKHSQKCHRFNKTSKRVKESLP